jgi:hypothetical protein
VGGEQKEAAASEGDAAAEDNAGTGDVNDTDEMTGCWIQKLCGNRGYRQYVWLGGQGVTSCGSSKGLSHGLNELSP